MKFLSIFLFSLLNCNLIFGQFAKIVDGDGFVNVRKEANSKSKIIGRIKSDEIVYVFNKGDDSGNWFIVDYHEKNGNFLTGYIHNTRINFINSLQQIPSVINSENSVNFILKNIVVEVKSGLFDYKANKKYFSKTNYGNYQIEDKYNGQQIWGTDGTIPKTYYRSIIAKIGNTKIEIPQKELENLFNINNDNAECYFDEKSDTLYITSMNSDGAGTYEVIFIINKEKYLGRRIYNAD